MWTTYVNNINVLYFFFARMHVLPSRGRSLDLLHAAIRQQSSKLAQILYINFANLELNVLFQC